MIDLTFETSIQCSPPYSTAIEILQSLAETWLPFASPTHAHEEALKLLTASGAIQRRIEYERLELRLTVDGIRWKGILDASRGKHEVKARGVVLKFMIEAIEKKKTRRRSDDRAQADIADRGERSEGETPKTVYPFDRRHVQARLRAIRVQEQAEYEQRDRDLDRLLREYQETLDTYELDIVDAGGRGVEPPDVAGLMAAMANAFMLWGFAVKGAELERPYLALDRQRFALWQRQRDAGPAFGLIDAALAADEAALQAIIDERGHCRDHRAFWRAVVALVHGIRDPEQQFGPIMANVEAVGWKQFHRDPLPGLSLDEQQRYRQGFDPDWWLPALECPNWQSECYPRHRTKDALNAWKTTIEEMIRETLGVLNNPEEADRMQANLVADLELIRHVAPELISDAREDVGEPEAPEAAASPDKPADEAGPARKGDADGEGMTKAVRLAGLSFEYAEVKQGGRLEDREAFDYLKEHDFDRDADELSDYILPSFETWTRYLRLWRKHMNQSKYRRRHRPKETRSIVAIDGLDTSRTDTKPD